MAMNNKMIVAERTSSTEVFIHNNLDSNQMYARRIYAVQVPRPAFSAWWGPPHKSFNHLDTDKISTWRRRVEMYYRTWRRVMDSVWIGIVYESGKSTRKRKR